MFVEQNKAIALRFATEGWGTNPNWKKAWDELVSSEIVHYFCSWAEPIRGIEANKKFAVSLFQGFPDIRQTIEETIAQEDKVMYRSTLQGTHTGIFMGIPPTGKVITVNGSFNLFRISEGKIVEWWYELNLLEVMKQMGVITEPALK
ncbi:ester cyclase [Scytonema millei]|uniref:Ester cyclase n=1 Tax=Scytonema millei VB511283 TaxID=1245923 RepID=A0A9X5E3V5_9CYAN|nr:ester cyclase [Scytonema millei]NHC33724.1 ester cyclase [Scytonema millei VB511283]